MSPARIIQVLAPLLLLVGLLAGQSHANQSIEVEWDDLLAPKSESLSKELDELQAAMDELDEFERETYYQIDDQAALKRYLDAGYVKQDDMVPRNRELLGMSFGETHPELVALRERVEVARAIYQEESERINQSLDGKSIRIPGYVLPLETEGTGLREFLLVPFVGACIHVPPPPSNQMVFVTIDQSYTSEGLFEPVWVEGVISTGKSSHDLSLVDGDAEVSTGYSMRAVKITKHAE